MCCFHILLVNGNKLSLEFPNSEFSEDQGAFPASDMNSRESTAHDHHLLPSLQPSNPGHPQFLPISLSESQVPQPSYEGANAGQGESSLECNTSHTASTTQTHSLVRATAQTTKARRETQIVAHFLPFDEDPGTSQADIYLEFSSPRACSSQL